MSENKRKNSDASGGSVKTGSSLGRGVFWFMTVFWNLIVGIIIYGVLTGTEEPGKNNQYLIYGVIGLFGLVGLVLLFIAFVRLFRYMKYGSSRLTLETDPGVLGGPFAARLTVPRKLYRDAEQMDVELTCMEVTYHRDPDGDRDKERRPLWEGTESVPVSEWEASENSRKLEVPISLTVPYNCEETDKQGNRQIHWILEVSADVPGLDYSAEFTVPVRETEASDPELTEEQVIRERDVERPEELEEISFRRTGDGFRFSRFLFHLPFGGFMLIFVGALFGGVVYFLSTQTGDVTIMQYLIFGVFFLVFGLVSVVCIVWGILSLFHSMTVRVTPRECRVTKKWFGIGGETIIPADEIENVTIESDATSGGDPLYRLYIHRSSSTPYKLSSLTYNKRVGEFLVQEFQRVFNL